MGIGLSEDAKPLAKDIDSGVVVSVVGSPAVWASPLSHLEVLNRRISVAADRTSLAGREEPVYRNQGATIPLGLVGELSAELAPSSVHDGLRQLMAFNHITGHQVLDTDDIILPNDICGQLMQHIPTLIGDVLIQPGNPDASLVPVGATLCFSG